MAVPPRRCTPRRRHLLRRSAAVRGRALVHTLGVSPNFEITVACGIPQIKSQHMWHTGECYATLFEKYVDP